MLAPMPMPGCLVKAIYWTRIAGISYLSFSAEASDSRNSKADAPCRTGPLLAPTTQTIPARHLDLKPYLLYTHAPGHDNDRHHKKKQQDSPRGGKSSHGVGDISLATDFQVMKQSPDN